MTSSDSGPTGSGVGPAKPAATPIPEGPAQETTRTAGAGKVPGPEQATRPRPPAEASTGGALDPLTGWRRALSSEAERLVFSAGEDRTDALVESAQEVQLLCALPLRRRRWSTAWVADRLFGREDRRFAAALAALYRARADSVLSCRTEVLVARLPQLRGEVKRYIDPTEPQFEKYLKLLDDLEQVPEPLVQTVPIIDVGGPP